MKNILFLSFIIISFQSCFAAKKTKKHLVKIQGIITQTSDYCGGARPSDEMLEQLAKPKPMIGKEIFIKIGPKNKAENSIYKKVITDSVGHFEIMLPTGAVYSFIEDWKSKPFITPKNTEYIKWDVACLYERYLTADYVLNVKSANNSMININFHKPCFFRPYCGSYSGPLPP